MATAHVLMVAAPALLGVRPKVTPILPAMGYMGYMAYIWCIYVHIYIYGILDLGIPRMFLWYGYPYLSVISGIRIFLSKAQPVTWEHTEIELET